MLEWALGGGGPGPVNWLARRYPIDENTAHLPGSRKASGRIARVGPSRSRIHLRVGLAFSESVHNLICKVMSHTVPLLLAPPPRGQLLRVSPFRATTP